VVPVPTGTNPEAWEAEFNFDPFEEEVKVARRWFPWQSTTQFNARGVYF